MTHKLIKNSELVLYGFVGAPAWMNDGFSADSVLEALAEFEDGDDIVVRINSGGGLAFSGVAIYNALRQKDANIIVRVDGIAASAASIIAMAGDEVIMGDGAMMMIHNASGFAMGTKEDFQKEAEVLNKLDGSLASIYVKATGLKESRVRKMMDEETWMTAEEAVDEGFATKMDEQTGDEEASTPVVFNYRAYKHPPPQFAALADVWAERTARAAAHSASKPAMEKQMTKQAAEPASPAAQAKITSASEVPQDIAAQIAAQAVAAERERIASLEEVAMPGYESLLADYRKDGTKTKNDLAIAIVQAEKQKKANLKQSLADDEKQVKNLSPQPTTTANDPVEIKPASAKTPEDEYANSKELQNEFPTIGDYKAFKKNEGRVRILQGRGSK